MRDARRQFIMALCESALEHATEPSQCLYKKREWHHDRGAKRNLRKGRGCQRPEAARGKVGRGVEVFCGVT